MTMLAIVALSVAIGLVVSARLTAKKRVTAFEEYVLAMVPLGVLNTVWCALDAKYGFVGLNVIMVIVGLVVLVRLRRGRYDIVPHERWPGLERAAAGLTAAYQRFVEAQSPGRGPASYAQLEEARRHMLFAALQSLDRLVYRDLPPRLQLCALNYTMSRQRWLVGNKEYLPDQRLLEFAERDLLAAARATQTQP